MGDFGLTGKSGGTTIFMAPEGLDKDARIIGKSDLYSFAVTVLFLMFPVDLALKLLFLPISEHLEIFLQSLYRFPLLELIFKSLRSNPEKRNSLQNWSISLKGIYNFDENMLIGKITSENLKRKGVILDPLNKASISEAGFEMDSIDVNKNEAWVMSKAV